MRIRRFVLSSVLPEERARGRLPLSRAVFASEHTCTIWLLPDDLFLSLPKRRTGNILPLARAVWSEDRSVTRLTSTCHSANRIINAESVQTLLLLGSLCNCERHRFLVAAISSLIKLMPISLRCAQTIPTCASNVALYTLPHLINARS